MSRHGALSMHSIQETNLRDLHGEDVHGYFGLTYANYLVLPRSLMQSMPADWQRRVVECLKELDDHFVGVPQAECYMVRAKTYDGKFAKDPVPYYNRGRTFVPPLED